MELKRVFYGTLTTFFLMLLFGSVLKALARTDTDRALGIVIACAVVWIGASLRVVQPGTAVVKRRLGHYVRVLQPGGPYFVFTPFESAVSVAWKTADAKLAISGTEIPTHNLNYDPPPVQCKTRDGVAVLADVIAVVRVSDPMRAMRNHANPLYEMSAALKHAVRQLVSDVSADDIDGLARKTGAKVLAAMEQIEAQYGIKVVAVSLETVRFANPDVEHERQQRVTQAWVLKQRENEHVLETRLQKERAEADLAVVVNKARAEAEAEVARYKAFEEAAVPREVIAKILDVDRARALAASAKVMVLPSDTVLKLDGRNVEPVV